MRRICLLILGPTRVPFVSIFRAIPTVRARQLTTICLLLLSAIFVPPQPAIAQTGGYAATATLNPLFIDPATGADLTYGEPLVPTGGLVRGADGWLYGITFRDGLYSDDTFAIIQVNPATGAARVLYLIATWYGGYFTPPTLFPGRDGRLYITIRDTASVSYIAPGKFLHEHENEGCSFGCVLFIDTAYNADLRSLHSFSPSAPTGFYVATWSPFTEDGDGAIYVETTSPGPQDCGPPPDENSDGADFTLVKISFDGEVTVLQSCYDPPFDWSTVTPSSHGVWHWSDGHDYSVSGQGVYQGALLLANIAATHGAPLEWLAEGSGYLYGMTCCGGAEWRRRVPHSRAVTGESRPDGHIRLRSTHIVSTGAQLQRH